LPLSEKWNREMIDPEVLTTQSKGYVLRYRPDLIDKINYTERWDQKFGTWKEHIAVFVSISGIAIYEAANQNVSKIIADETNKKIETEKERVRLEGEVENEKARLEEEEKKEKARLLKLEIAKNKARLKASAAKIRKEKEESKQEEIKKQKETEAAFLSALSSATYQSDEGRFKLADTDINFVATQKLLEVKKFEFDFKNGFIRGQLVINGSPLPVEVTKSEVVSGIADHFEILATLLRFSGTEAMGFFIGDPPPFNNILAAPSVRARKECGKISKPEDWIVIVIDTDNQDLIEKQKCYNRMFASEEENASLLYKIMLSVAPSVRKYLLHHQ